MTQDSINKLSNDCKFEIRARYGECTTRVPVDQAPAGPALDAAVAEAAGYIQVPFATGKKTPPELKDVPITEKRYVYILVWGDESDFQRGVWRRRHGGGDFFLWQPSTDIRNAWELVSNFNPDKLIMVKVILTSYSNPGCEWFYYDNDEDSDPEKEIYIEADTAPLAITRAYLKAKGVEWVEVPD